MKILYITTIGSTMNFFKVLIRELIDEGHVVDIATNEALAPVADCYREWGCKVYPISCTRSPIHKGTITAIREIRQIVKDNGYDIVHCHTPVASICTRLACRSLRKNGLKVLYTAHGFHFYKGAPLKNWLMYYPMEKLCAYFTDLLITINQEDYQLAKAKMKARRVEYVPGVGLEIQKFQNAIAHRQQMRNELGIPENAILMTSVGELNANKNHQVVIRAMGQLGMKNLHYMIVGKGALREELLHLAKELGMDANVHLVGYRTDIAQLYIISDICIFPSIREGLGLAALEGMAVGLPVVASDNRGTRDYAVHNDNAFLCPHDSVSAFAEAIQTLAADAALRQKMGAKNAVIAQQYDIGKINTKMKEIYQSLEKNT